jgi:hypothetical protein
VRFFTTLKLGPNRDKTPEGFLLCRNVPIGRTGMQLYGPGETPVTDGADGTVKIHRRPEDVFRDETVSSFNGKPVTIDHPDTDVTPENWKELSVGVVLDARRGLGAEDDLLIADLLITDKDAIAKVLDEGLEEISSGYDAEYEEESEGVGYQVDILGNHVALVDQGRCGPRCSIRDAEVEMKVISKPTKVAVTKFKDKVRSAFKAKDQDDLEQILETIEEAADEGGLVGETHIHIHTDGDDEDDSDNGNGETATDKGAKDQDEPVDVAGRLDAIDRTLSNINDRLSALEGSDESVSDKKSKDDEGETKKKETEDSDVTEETSDSAKSDAGKTTDSRYMEESIQATMAAAEVLAPGISFPTFDSATKARETVDSLTTLRKKALSIASSSTVGAAMLAELRGDRPLTHDALQRLSVKDTRNLFFSAAAQMKQLNRAQTHAVGFSTNDRPGPITIKKLNEINREYWAKRVV